MAGACRQNRDVTRLKRENFAFDPADLYSPAAARHT
jgi:hypothetical protein